MPFCKKKIKNTFCSAKSNIAYIHTNQIHKYLSVRTKRSKFPRFFLLVPNSQERSSSKKRASMGGKILARLAPSPLAEEISAGLCDRETHIHRNSDICMQFKEVHWKQRKTISRCSISDFLPDSRPQEIDNNGMITQSRLLKCTGGPAAPVGKNTGTFCFRHKRCHEGRRCGHLRMSRAERGARNCQEESQGSERASQGVK